MVPDLWRMDYDHVTITIQNTHTTGGTGLSLVHIECDILIRA